MNIPLKEMSTEDRAKGKVVSTKDIEAGQLYRLYGTDGKSQIILITRSSNTSFDYVYYLPILETGTQKAGRPALTEASRRTLTFEEIGITNKKPKESKYLVKLSALAPIPEKDYEFFKR